MRWTVTVRDQTYGRGADIPKYSCRVTRSEGTVRLSVENLGSGVVREGRFLMPSSLARTLGQALLLAAEGTEPVDVVFSVDEQKR